MVLRDLQNDVSSKLIENESTELGQTVKEINQLEEIIEKLSNIGSEGQEPITIELLDPQWPFHDH